MLLSGRWKVDAKGEKILHHISKKPILQFVSIKRKDCGEWAIPGVGWLFPHFLVHFPVHITSATILEDKTHILVSLL